MRRRLVAAFGPWLALLLLAGCSAILGIPSDVDERASDAAAESTIGSEGGGGDAADANADMSATDAGDADAADGSIIPVDAGPLCDPTKDFLAPTLISSVNKTGTEGSPRLSDDELTIYFSAKRGGDPYYDLYMAVRGVLTDSFFNIAPIPGAANTTDNYEFQPNITDNGLTMFFERQNAITEDSDLYMTTRSVKTGPFVTATLIPDVNSMPGYDAKIFMRGDGTEFYYSKANPAAGGTTDILFAKKAGANWTTTTLPVINDPLLDDYGPVISKDGLTLFFSSPRPSGVGGPAGFNIWVAKRAVATADFGDPVLVPNVNSDAFDEPGWISVDGCRLYMTSQRAAGKQNIYVAKRPK